MPRRLGSRLLSGCALAAALCFAATGTAAAAPSAEAGGSDLRFDLASGTFGAPGSGASALTYDPKLVPDGAQARVITAGHPLLGTATGLVVTGLLPDREYGAHAHVNRCGANGDAAGPHFQHKTDPVQPSVDPAFANPRNEVWLDFTTGASGAGFATSRVDWAATGGRAPKSVVIHEEHTHTGPGHAGMAGDRLACINVDF